MKENMEIMLSGGIANFGELSNDKFFDILMANHDGVEFYKFQPIPGKIYASALKWKVIGKTADILGIVSFIWLVYTEAIKPKKEIDSNAGIYIHFENIGPNNQIWIGNNVNSEKELQEHIEKAIKELEENAEENKLIIYGLKNSPSWKKIK